MYDASTDTTRDDLNVVAVMMEEVQVFGRQSPALRDKEREAKEKKCLSSSHGGSGIAVMWWFLSLGFPEREFLCMCLQCLGAVDPRVMLAPPEGNNGANVDIFLHSSINLLRVVTRTVDTEAA